MGDVNNHYDALDRSLKKVGIVLVDDLGLLRNGKASQCIDLLRKLLLSTSVPIAKMLLQRGCPSHASDRKLVSAAFELVRDKVKFLPSLTVDQFFKEGFAAHKLAILVKLAGYILEVDKSFAKTTPPKIMYVVPTQVGLNSTTMESNDGADSLADANESTAIDDDAGAEVAAEQPEGVGSPNGLPTPPPAPAPVRSAPSSATKAATANASNEWPMTDFIKKHILDTKLKNAAKSSPQQNGRPRSTSASRGGNSHSRSTTPSSVRRPGTRRDVDDLSLVDIYDIEEKTAALEAVQALRAARNSRNMRVDAALSVGAAQPHTPTSTYAAEAQHHHLFQNGSTLTELAAADVGTSLSYPNPSTSPRRAAGTVRMADGFDVPAAPAAAAGSAASAVDVQSVAFQEALRRAVDAAVQEKLTNDPDVQQAIDRRVEAAVQARLQQTVQDISTKYDFIINKLVAAVDAEFTLLNNKLALAQQAQLYPQSPQLQMPGHGQEGALEPY